MIQHAALKIAAKGIPVFPIHSLDDDGVCTCGGPEVNPKCSPGKHPRTPRGFKDATTDPVVITDWWTRWPEAKIGMPTGSRSGVFVKDVDRMEALGELPREMPETLTVRTPSGGLHFYFEHVEGLTNRIGALPSGIDIRGEGGYVIVPPSPGYIVECRAPIAAAPDWLLEILRDEPRRKASGPGRTRSSATTSDEGEPIHEGGRDETITRIAGRLHDGTRDLAQLEDELQAVNETRCIPPLPTGQVRKIARSVYRYEPCRPARREPDPETVEALTVIERDILGREWKGQGGKTAYSIAVAALKLARQYGTLVEDGVRLEVSDRQLALATAVSRRTITSKKKNMGEILRPDNENAEPGKSGAIVLLLPRAALHHSTHRVSYRGGCAKWRSPYTAPRLRWSSPAKKPRRGVTPGTSRVRYGPPSKKRSAVIRLGKGCESIMDHLEAAGGRMHRDDLAAAVGVERPRDLTRRRNPATGKGRDGYVTRLEGVGVLTIEGDYFTLTEEWLEALNRERERSGEIALHRRDMARYNRERQGFSNRHKVNASHHYANRGADGWAEDLQPAGGDPEPPPDRGEGPASVSPLAAAIRSYLESNPGDACQPPGWIGATLWAHDLYPGKPTPAETRAALEELGGEKYLRERLEDARGVA